MAVKLVGGIAACLIAFMGIMGFVNGLLDAIAKRSAAARVPAT